MADIHHSMRRPWRLGKHRRDRSPPHKGKAAFVHRRLELDLEFPPLVLQSLHSQRHRGQVRLCLLWCKLLGSCIHLPLRSRDGEPGYLAEPRMPKNRLICPPIPSKSWQSGLSLEEINALWQSGVSPRKSIAWNREIRSQNHRIGEGDKIREVANAPRDAQVSGNDKPKPVSTHQEHSLPRPSDATAV